MRAKRAEDLLCLLNCRSRGIHGNSDGSAPKNHTPFPFTSHVDASVGVKPISAIPFLRVFRGSGSSLEKQVLRLISLASGYFFGSRISPMR